MKFAKFESAFFMVAFICAVLSMGQAQPHHCNICDLDRDGDCDAADYALFSECFNEQQPTPSPTPSASPSPTPPPSPTPAPTNTPSPSPSPTANPSPTPGPTSPPVGFGSTEDIQSAIDTAQPGAVITIPSGTYSATNNSYTTPLLVVSKPMTIRGQGAVTLDAGASYGTSNTGHRQGIRISADNVTLENMTIRRAHREGVMVGPVSGVVLRGIVVRESGLNPSNAESAGIKLNRSTSFLVENCAAFHCYSGIVTKVATNGTIRHCWSQGSGVMADGTVIYPENANGYHTSPARNGSEAVHITSCGAVDCADDGYDMSHSRQCTVSYSFAIASNSRGLADGDGGGFKVGNNAEGLGEIFECRDMSVLDCYALSNRGSGIDGRDCRGHTYRNLVCYGNGTPFAFSGGNDTTTPKTFDNIIAIGPVPARDLPHVQRIDPGWADPDKAIDATWQGSARETWEHVWDQLTANFGVGQ